MALNLAITASDNKADFTFSDGRVVSNLPVDGIIWSRNGDLFSFKYISNNLTTNIVSILESNITAPSHTDGDDLETELDTLFQVAGEGGGAWGDITGDLSDQTDLQDALDTKQATLVSGTDIKTIDGVSVLGSGNIATNSTGSKLYLASNFI